MDVVSIVATIWRHRLAAIPVIVLTLVAAFYVLEVKAPTYQASASVLLVEPPTAPSAGQIAADPALGKENTSNPYVSYGDLSVVADVVISQVTSPAGQQALVREGADPRYQATLSTAFGSPPIILVTGVADSAQTAVTSADLVMKAISKDLLQAQQGQNVGSRYMIRALNIVQPTQAQATVSGKLRTLIAVLAIGLLLLLVAVSVSQTISRRRENPAGGRPPAALVSMPIANGAGVAEPAVRKDSSQFELSDDTVQFRLEEQATQRKPLGHRS